MQNPYVTPLMRMKQIIREEAARAQAELAKSDDSADQYVAEYRLSNRKLGEMAKRALNYMDSINHGHNGGDATAEQYREAAHWTIGRQLRGRRGTGRRGG